MTKNIYPIQLTIQGDVEAYSDEQIRDDVVDLLPDFNREMFGNTMMHSRLLVGEKEFLFTGITKRELNEKLAKELFEDRREFGVFIIKHLEQAADLVGYSSGWIFKHAGSVEAANGLLRFIEVLAPYRKKWFELSDEEKWPYLERAQEIMNKTLWYHTMIKEK